MSDVFNKVQFNKQFYNEELKSKLWLETVLDNSLMSIMALKAIRDNDNTIIDFEYFYINKKAESSVNRIGLTGKRVLQEFPGAKTSGLFDHYLEVVETGIPWKDEIFYNYDGFEFWASVKANKLNDGCLVMYDDITERKETEREILKLKEELAKKATDKYLTLFNFIDEGFCIIKMIFDKQGNPFDYRFLEVNPSFEKLTGLTNVIGKTVRELIPGIENYWLNTYGNIAKTGIPVRFEDRAGNIFGGVWYDLYAFPFGNTEDNHIAVLFNDITNRKRTEEALVLKSKEAETAFQKEKAINEELRRINQVMDNFVYSAAHDLKAPISNMKLLTEVINSTDDKEFKLQLQNQYLPTIKMLDQVISGLINVLAIETNPGIIKQLHFKNVFNEVIKEFNGKFNNADTEIITDFTACISISYIESYLFSIFRNILSNALKFRSKEQKLKIEIQSKNADKYILLIFNDNGIGIDLENFGKDLFLPFKRLNRQTEGSGIGLHLVKNIVTKNGGKIEIESKVGEGTMFSIFLIQYN